MRIAFSPETGGIVSIVNTYTGHNFISAQTEKPKLWRLVIRKKDGKEVQLGNDDCAPPTITLAKR